MQISAINNNPNFKGLFGEKTEYSRGHGNVTHSYITHHYYPFCNQSKRSIGYAIEKKIGVFTYYPDQTGGEYYIEHNRCKVEKPLPITSKQYSWYKKGRPLKQYLVDFIEKTLIENGLSYLLRKPL